MEAAADGPTPEPDCSDVPASSAKSADEQAPKGTNSGRKRNRKGKLQVVNKLVAQLKFYFSDANLWHDKFLRDKVEECSEGYVPISLLSSFAKVSTVTKDQGIVTQAARQCAPDLEVSSDGQKVRRATPLPPPPNDLDEYMVYVEKLPDNVDHEFVKKKFEVFGSVAHVSLPKFKRKGGVKGFAFVHFGEKASAQAAFEYFNGECPGTKDSAAEQAEQHTAVCTSGETTHSMETMTSSADAHRHSDCASSEDAGAHGSRVPVKGGKRRHAEAESDGSDEESDAETRTLPDDTAGSKKKKKKKRTKLDVAKEDERQPSKSKRGDATIKTEDGELSRKSKHGDATIKTEDSEKKSKCDDATIKTKDSELSRKKRKRNTEYSDSEEEQDDHPAAKRVDGQSDEAEGVPVAADGDEKKKKKRSRSHWKRKNKQNVVKITFGDWKPNVMTKRKWSDLKEEYKSLLQQQNIAAKEYYRSQADALHQFQAARPQRSHSLASDAIAAGGVTGRHNSISDSEVDGWTTADDSVVGDVDVIDAHTSTTTITDHNGDGQMANPNVGHGNDSTGDAQTSSSSPVPCEDFVVGTVLNLTWTDACDTRPWTAVLLKRSLAELSNVKFVDFKAGEQQAHVRCETAQQSSVLLDKLQTSSSKREGMRKPTRVYLLTGSEERSYWQQLAESRQKTHESRKSRCRKSRKRHANQFNALASKEQADGSATKHIVFDEQN